MSLTGSPTFWFCIEWGHKVYSQLWAKYVFSIALPSPNSQENWQKKFPGMSSILKYVFEMLLCLEKGCIFTSRQKPEEWRNVVEPLGSTFQCLGKALFLPPTSSFHLLLLHILSSHQSLSPLLFRGFTLQHGDEGLLLTAASISEQFLVKHTCQHELSAPFYGLWPNIIESHQWWVFLVILPW